MFGVPHRYAGVQHVWRAEVAEKAEQGPQHLCPVGRGVRGPKQARGRVYKGNGEQRLEVKRLIRRPWK